MTALRAKAREQNVYVRVVRNTLAKRAVQGTEFECVNDVLVGPTLFAFSMEDPGAAARLLKDFAKEDKDFEIKALAVGGELLGADQIDRLAKSFRRVTKRCRSWLAQSRLRSPSWHGPLTRFRPRLPARWLQFVTKKKEA